MCFSSTASFTAAAGLTAIGAWNLHTNEDRRLIPIAAAPLLFAVQQATEGGIWLLATHGSGLQGPAFEALTWVYMIFAVAVWAAWIPLAFAVAEPRRRPLALLAGLGVLYGLASIATMGWIGLQVELVDGHMRYSLGAIGWAFTILTRVGYVGLVLAPGLLSTLRGSRGVTLVLGISFVVAQVIYAQTFVSVWCFFAAVASAGLWRLLRLNQLDQLDRLERLEHARAR